MLILVAVTVNVALNGGLFEKAQWAGSGTQKEAEKETLNAAIVSAMNEKLQIATAGDLENNLPTGWNVTDGEGETYIVTSPKENVYTVLKTGKILDDGEGEPQATDQKYFTYTFNEDDKTATITGVAEEYAVATYYEGFNDITSIKDGEKYITDIVLPSTVTNNEKTYTVTEIGEKAFYVYANPRLLNAESWFTSFTIPNTVINIGNLSFENCGGLRNVTIGNGVTSIGLAAFSGCNSLTNITIPNSVISIGDSAFYNCSTLTNITIPDSVTSIGNHAFYNCSSLTNITIPNGVTSIGEYAFLDCSSLTDVTIGNSVTNIGNGAFYRCSSLTNVSIPNSVISIGDSAFAGCTSLTNIIIPNSVTSMESYVFSGGNSNLEIKCRATGQPSGWDSNWNRMGYNGEYYTTTWGYTGE